ncbi:MAG: integrase arm-type DNA-binding domain-containing protein [Burkholderiaceae bacterium]|nr:integrase arm-type DNA-binding domain-containing protein [Burkholderiaceae bacterium]
MPKRAKELTALQVKRLTVPGLHFVGGVPGLALQVTEQGARTWLLRYSVGTKRREMGLGSFDGVPLAEAREAARKARDQLREGVDPIDQRRAVRSAMIAESARQVTFDEAARRYIKTHAPGWRSAKHAQQWKNTLASYASPRLGRMLVRDIDSPHVVEVLRPIWQTKHETAARLRGRIEKILDWAYSARLRTGENPARWAVLKPLLLDPTKAADKGHHPALDWREVGDFWAELGKAEGIAARALQFGILTAMRHTAVVGARWEEIDLQAGVWTVPAERMKAAGKKKPTPHRVPLAPAALELLRSVPRLEGSELVFPSSRGQSTLSDRSLKAVIERLHEARVQAGGAGWIDRNEGNRIATPHGIARSTFKTWAADATKFPHELSEKALAHEEESKVVAAYQRGDQLERRRPLMVEWARFLATPSAKAASVTPIRGAA